MPNELQLRQALAHRADAVDDRAEIALLTGVHFATAQPRPATRITAAMAVLASVAVAAAIAAVVVITHWGGLQEQPPAGSTLRSAATNPSIRRGPSVSLTPGVVDRIVVTTNYEQTYDLRPDVEYVTVQLPSSRHATVAAYANVTGFGPARVHDAVPVTVSGRRGLFGAVSDWPANGLPDPATGKQDGAQPSVAWQLPSGTWVLVQSDDPSQRSASGLASLADSLAIGDAVDVTRLPFVAPDLPTGLALTGISRTVQGSLTRDTTVTLTGSAQRGFTIEVGRQLLPDPVDPAGFPIASRGAGRVVVLVGGHQQTQQAVDDLLAGIHVVPDPEHETTSWPTCEDALG